MYVIPQLHILGSRRFEQKLTDMMIPNKYLELHKKIIAEAGDFRLHKERKGPPILSWKQILEYELFIYHCIAIITFICRIGEKYNFEEEELVVAIKYLKSQGL